MGQFTSFAEVLEQKIRRKIEQEIRPEAQSTSTSTQWDNSPDCLASLLGNVQPLRQNPEVKAYVYHRHNQGPKRAPRPKPNHVLNEAQQRAWQFFKQAGANELAQNYSLNELKTEFRKLALRLHPDRPQGSASLFIQLKAAFESLRLVFSK